jgi:hypothetical protein
LRFAIASSGFTALVSFPKSLDISKEIDKKLGAERKTVGLKPYTNDGSIRGNSYNKGGYERVQLPITAPATPEAQQWDGWGTALKPANEPIVLARKPLSEKTIAENVMKWGTGGLNIDGCRIGTEEIKTYGKRKGQGVSLEWSKYTSPEGYEGETHQGRFPANVILDEEAGRMLDEQQKGASRFFYCAKASKKERNMGLEDVEPTTVDDGRNKPIDNPFLRGKTLRQNSHPTVKPVKLMEYLITLITPPNGIVLDPFLGSGTTALAALNLGRFFIGIELNEEYCEIARRRIEQHKTQTELFA